MEKYSKLKIGKKEAHDTSDAGGSGRSLGCKGNSTHLSVTIRFWCNDNPILSQKYCTVNHELALKIQIKKLQLEAFRPQTSVIRPYAAVEKVPLKIHLSAS